MEDRNDINKFRQKTKRRGFFFKFAMVLLVALALILVAMNWEKIISPLKDAALDVGEGGFPVSLPGSTGYVLDSIGDNFYLLTDTYLYTYNSDGANIASIQHGFQNPVCSSNDKRVMIYDKNGKGFKLYSRMSEIYSNTTDDSIVFGTVGSSERCAIVTTSTRYSNYLYVFNSEGKQIFRWASPDNKIMQVCFSNNDESIFVSTLGEKGGELRLNILRFDLDNAENTVWQTNIGNDITYSIEYCSDGIYVVTSGGSVLLDKNSGEILEQGSFSKSVFGIPDTDGLRAVIFVDSGSNGETVAVFSDELDVEYTLSPDSISDFDVNKGKLYLLTGTELSVYDSTLTQTAVYELDDSYSDVKIIGSNAYLLGYNTVQRVIL